LALDLLQGGSLYGGSFSMNIFLSYASPDKATAESIAFSLRSRGYKVFLDRDDLPAGGSYDHQIERAVKDSEIFIFLISPDSVGEGRYTLTELTFARYKWKDPNGHVLPVMSRKTPLEQIPSYLKAVTILEPQGSVTAETSAAVDNMRRGGSAIAAGGRFAAEFFGGRRKALALGALCGLAGIAAFGLVVNYEAGPTAGPRDLPAPHAAPINCSEEPNLRSLGTAYNTWITFTNKGEKTIRVYWLDFEGKRVLYGTLARNQVLRLQTYVTHPWVITDTMDECKAIYMPASQPIEIAVAI
jgi:hypothetical protein